MNPAIIKVRDRIARKSHNLRADYEKRMDAANEQFPARKSLSCGNFAHGMAACPEVQKQALKQDCVNLAIISAYNEMLSAHQPFHRFPGIIKDAVAALGGVAQFAGGVPAMCDGVTQGQVGMELSLFSRDTIALSTAIALSHNMFDAAVFLGTCDKIVPGILIGALSFGHLPGIFLPAGPMMTGLSNKEKSQAREKYAKGEIERKELLEVESKSYHSPGTCTFYGTANSNQMLMEFMGLHVAGASFINPSDPLRDALTRYGTQLIAKRTIRGSRYLPLYKLVTVESLVNGIVGLLATGGSTNLTIHLIAIARAASILIDWDDMATLSEQVPLLARVYPNGHEDINSFQQSGGLSIVFEQLLDRGLLFENVETVMGQGIEHYTKRPCLDPAGSVVHISGNAQSGDESIICSGGRQFQDNGGLTLLKGNLGRAIMKTSAVAKEHLVMQAPAAVYDSPEDMLEAFKSGDLHRDVVVVIRFQGPQANGMPELHQLTPPLGVLQNLGYKIALLTDGRMSGASGKIPAAIHLSPEAYNRGIIAKIRDGDMVHFDAINGELELLVSDEELQARPVAQPKESISSQWGVGRELFVNFRHSVLGAEEGASVLYGARQ